ncbi:unnamed protein product [Pedinophyceae sp. YPF-701]|nr:unnamed protein product [Pedinophyceae sp. YPF-701]
MGGKRHSKNAGVMGREALTYHERRALGFGTVQERVGKDAISNFDDCRLSLSPAVDPVASPQGVVFSRESILEYLVAQKKELKRRMRAWEEHEARREERDRAAAAAEEQARLAEFDRVNHAGMSDQRAREVADAMRSEAGADKHHIQSVIAIGDIERRRREDKSFWAADKVPEAEAAVEKPDMHPRCPVTGRKLKLKDLVAVKFTPIPGGPTEAGANGQVLRYMDPVTKDTLTNRSKLVLLKPTGDVVLASTWKKVIEPDGEYNGRKVTAKDVIELRSGGTGFAAHDKEETQAKRYAVLGIGNGVAPLRGQTQGPASNAGLRFNN